MLNQGVVRLLIGKSLSDAIASLEAFSCKWRVYAIDDIVSETSPERDDNRYNLVINNNQVVRVIAG